MKRLITCFCSLLFAGMLLITLAACSKSGTSGNAGGRSAGKTADWKKIYLEELLAAQAYSKAADWEKHDHFTSKYPMELYGAQLVDLNFDGTPELFLFGPGAGASQEMRILAINGSKAEMIYNSWGNLGVINLLRKTGGGTLAFGFEGSNGDLENYGGAFYLTTDETKMDKNFEKSAKFAEFVEMHQYQTNDQTHDLIELGSEYIFNGRNVSGENYRQFLEDVFADYENLPYRPIGMIWDSDWSGDSYHITLLTEDQIMPFLESFEPEDGMGDPGYWVSENDSDDLVSYLIAMVDKADELVNKHGMSALVTGETVELDGVVCRIVILGTDHDNQFVREIYYAISYEGEIYEYDPIEDVWYLMYAFGAVG